MMEFLRRFVFHNFPLKVIALASAVLLWSAIAREPLAEIAFQVPIAFQHVPKHLEMIADEIPQAQVRVRGPARVLRELNAADLNPVLDLSDAQPGERTYEVRVEKVQVPFDVTVVQVVPAQVRIRFDRHATRLVPVEARVTGTPASGFAVSQIVVEPQNAEVQGPEQRVNLLDAVKTDLVDVTGLNGRVSFVVSVNAGDPQVRVAHDAKVRVTVVAQRLAEAPAK